MTQTLAEAIARAAGGTLADWRVVPGGDINQALRVDLADDRALFAKHRPDPPPGFYAAEAAGLRWLGEAEVLPVAEVVAVDDAFLALAWIDSAPRAAGFESALGEGLARLHQAGADRHGATPDDAPAFLGSVALPGAGEVPAPGWPQFYAHRRLAPLLRTAADRDALSPATVRRVETVIDRIEDLVGPPEPPARLHGDLWSGNVMADARGRPALVDPAAYGGHRQIDLAMLRLFGAPGPALTDAYEAVHPLADGHADRVDLWQLLPLLLHAVLFGGSYGAAVDRAARRYAR